MNELGTLVEKSRVVLIGLDHKKLRSPVTRRHAEIGGDPSDQETGIETGVLENPRQHARGRRLAVRSRYRQDMPILQDVLRQPLWTRLVGHPPIEHRFNDFGAARHDVADDDAVRIDIELRGVNALVNLDIELAQLRAHGRIDIAITAGDLVPRCACERRDAAHEGSTDSEYVNMHDGSGCGVGTQEVVKKPLENEDGHRRGDADVPVPVDCTRDDMPLDGY